MSDEAPFWCVQSVLLMYDLELRDLERAHNWTLQEVSSYESAKGYHPVPMGLELAAEFLGGLVEAEQARLARLRATEPTSAEQERPDA